jgi:hypothetical protein
MWTRPVVLSTLEARQTRRWNDRQGPSSRSRPPKMVAAPAPDAEALREAAPSWNEGRP